VSDVLCSASVHGKETKARCFSNAELFAQSPMWGSGCGGGRQIFFILVNKINK
jgi:hypothetical protein